MRDPFAAPRQSIPDPDALETELAWTHARYRNVLARYVPLWPPEPEPELFQEQPNHNGPSTWAEQEQESIKRHVRHAA